MPDCSPKLCTQSSLASAVPASSFSAELFPCEPFQSLFPESWLLWGAFNSGKRMTEVTLKAASLQAPAYTPGLSQDAPQTISRSPPGLSQVPPQDCLKILPRTVSRSSPGPSQYSPRTISRPLQDHLKIPPRTVSRSP